MPSIELTTPMVLSLLALGLTAGILSGLFGIGGGLVIVPALFLFFAFPIKTATGTSLFAILWPVGLLGVLEYARRGQVSYLAGGLIAFGLFLGAFLGALATGYLSASQMKRLYGGFLVVVGIYYLMTAGSVPGAKPPVADLPNQDQEAVVQPPETDDRPS